MSVLYPLKLNGNRFYVNPITIDIKKRSMIGETRTMSGTTFHIWPDLPDEVVFEGLSFNVLSILEIRNMSSSMERSPELKQVEMVYKHHTYQGFLRFLGLSADANRPRVLNYKFGYVVKSGGINDRFVSEDLTIGQTTGFSETFDFLQAQISGASTTITNIPSNDVANVLNVANSIGRIGLNIGRPTLPSTSSFMP